MRCPKCKYTQLKQGTVKKSGVQIDFCPTCKGFWLDKGEMRTVCKTAVRRLTIPPDAKASHWLCSHCKIQLHSFTYPDTMVTIEMCPECSGMWIDAGELKEIEAVRTGLEKNKPVKDPDEVGGIKGMLLQFINDAFAYLQYK